GFAGGSTLSAADAEYVGRLATAFARDARPRTAGASPFAPAPVVPNGRWQTPIEIDPLELPVGEVMETYRTGMVEVRKLKGLASFGGIPGWNRSDRVFASTEGSVIVQRTYVSQPGVGAHVMRPIDRRMLVGATIDVPDGGYGFETIAKLDLVTEWRKA